MSKGIIEARKDGRPLAPVAEVKKRMVSLTALQVELELMVEGCRHGYVSECRVIEVLADHGKCDHEHP